MASRDDMFVNSREFNEFVDNVLNESGSESENECEYNEDVQNVISSESEQESESDDEVPNWNWTRESNVVQQLFLQVIWDLVL